MVSGKWVGGLGRREESGIQDYTDHLPSAEPEDQPFALCAQTQTNSLPRPLRLNSTSTATLPLILTARLRRWRLYR